MNRSPPKLFYEWNLNVHVQEQENRRSMAINLHLGFSSEPISFDFAFSNAAAFELSGNPEGLPRYPQSVPIDW